MYDHATMTILVAIEAPARMQAFAAALNGASDSYSPVCVSEPSQADAYLADRAPAVVVTDANTPAVADALRAKYPNAPLILVAERIETPQVEVAVRTQAAAMVRLPCDAADLRRVIEAPTPAKEFAGTCRGVSTAMLLALYCGSGADGVLYLVRAEDAVSGCIHLEGGQPVHAACGATVGPDAVKQMLGWHDAGARFIAGRTGAARTVVGRWEAVLADTRGPSHDDMLPVAIPQVMEKLARLSQTPDILGAFLIRNAEIVTGRCLPELDEKVLGRALCRMSNAFADIDGVEGEDAGREIQAMLGTVRLVVDRLGPKEMGYQVGVVVRQASPVCKSLRRLLRQIDRSFSRALAKGANGPGGRLAVA